MTIPACSVPVLFIIFNRPDSTSRVFEKIRQAKPSRLYIAADGPREGREDDIQSCQETRAITEQIDWDAEVFRDFSEKNLGCRDRVISALNWIFSQEERAIILEDDCVPHPSFFRFCEELLERYRDDRRVMSITGSNPQGDRKRRNQDSYFFSYFPYIWGWATWRRAWHLFDSELKDWPEVKKDKWLVDLFGQRSTAKIWENILNARIERSGKASAWDPHWKYSCFVQSAFCIIPSVNLITNIGFGETATHTKQSIVYNANMPTEEMRFPLVEPRCMIRDRDVERFIQKKLVTPFHVRARRKLLKPFARFFK